jgi:hypothetical protein
MKYISPFNTYNEEIIVQQIIEYIDYSINESVDIKSIWNNTLRKIEGLSKEAKRKIIKYAIGSLLVFNTVTNVVQIINSSSADADTKQIATEMCEEKEEEEKYKKGYDWTLSQEGWDHIKNEEKCKLVAYSIGDGMITVGYGDITPKSDITRLFNILIMFLTSIIFAYVMNCTAVTFIEYDIR